MNAKELHRLKVQRFGEASKRTGTPLEYYELPAEVIAKYEQEKEQTRQQRKADRAKLNPTRGEFSFQRLSRRPVGDY